MRNYGLANVNHHILGDFGPSQSQKLAHEMRFFLTLINSSPTPSTTDVGQPNNLPLTHRALGRRSDNPVSPDGPRLVDDLGSDTSFR